MDNDLKFYWAYGSNLNVAQMRVRCPDAIKCESLAVRHLQLCFRSVADVRYKRGGVCPGGLWLISPDDEKALDAYEGVSGGLYAKRTFQLECEDGTIHPVLYYKMNRGGLMPPSKHYLNSIVQGYIDFEMPNFRALQNAVQRAWDGKESTPYLRWRRERDGYPELAREVRLPVQRIAP